MLNVSVIGIGNAGNQVAALAKQAGFSAMALNSSDKDLSTVKSVVTTLIVGDEKGAGKDRNTAKAFIKESIREMLAEKYLDDVLVGQDVVAIVSSTGGGTGSGMAPMLQAILSNMYPQTHFIVVGILPPVSESLAGQQNSLEYLQEMKKTNPTYMLYDNGKHEKLGTVSMFHNVNNDIVEDLKVIRGDYQITTPYSSIDEKDSMKIYQTPGRLVVAKASGFREKDVDEQSIEQRLINAVKSGSQVELETDRKVKRLGLIVNLSQNIYETMDATTPDIKKAFGEPIEGFEHIAISDQLESVAALLMAGLNFPDDRIVRTMQKIEEVQSKLTARKSSILDTIETESIAEIRSDGEKSVPAMDLDDILSGY